MAKKKETKGVKPIDFEIKTKKVTGKSLTITVDGEPEGEVVKLAVAGKKTRPVYLTADYASAKRPIDTVKVHRTERAAITRVTRRFPKIMPRVWKRL